MKLITQMTRELTIHQQGIIVNDSEHTKHWVNLGHLLTMLSLPCGSPSVSLRLRIMLFAYATLQALFVYFSPLTT